MPIKSIITNRAEIKFEDHQVICNDSFKLIEKITELKKQHGIDPKNWPLDKIKKNDSEEILIHEFVSLLQNKYKLSYQHEEICHCRSVPTETVIQGIKQGARSLKEISRATKAGTGCGTCVGHLKILLDEITK